MSDSPPPLAVVTGGAGGIGRAVTAALTRAGHRVLSVDREPAADPSAYAALVADLAVPVQAQRLLDDVHERYGLPAVLVNNAGVYPARDFLDYDPRTYAEVLDTNLGATFFGTLAYARALVAAGRPGTVVNVASISGRIGSPDAAYGASKGAVVALTRSLGRALAVHRIRVNAVAPGLVETPMAARIPAARQDDYRARIPAGRFGAPDEIAAAVAWLAGPDSSYVTASVLDVDGGLH
ncbi:SDR family oxidoreductase [Micromonospora sp. CPM1]|uniref:SDR family NAD(P)-dependent oxidoreductase n=1 Tax=Micromonospora sp. CPM1 TaxID=2944809 RepID=UPI00207C61C9|nr:SDR family oxidoreductase [Micromonospora sp. CPM1]MCO1614325.1 SDR family oxidoreductase [Micromonospora sp. CPM1]